MAIKKAPEVVRIERVIEDHKRREYQAKMAGQKSRAKLHRAQVRLWEKQLAKVASPTVTRPLAA
jgi:hypothetical protein